MDLVSLEDQLSLRLPEASRPSIPTPIMGLLVGRALERTGTCAFLTQLRDPRAVGTDGWAEESRESGVAGQAA